MEQKDYPYYEVERIKTLQHLIDYRAKISGLEVAFRYRLRGQIKEVSFVQFYKEIEVLKNRIHTEGYLDGIRIGILGENSYEWILAFFSIVCGGNIAVPLDKELSGEELSSLTSDSGCELLFYSETYKEKAEDVKMHHEKLKTISFHDIMQYCQEYLLKMQGMEYKDIESKENINEKTLAAIVYTSGTTGKSKGVVLTHGNIALDTYLACRNFFMAGNTVLLLPLHHTFGLTAGVLVTFLYGGTVFINGSLRDLGEDFQLAKPKTLFLVPLFVENLYKSVLLPAIKAGIGAKVFGGHLDIIVSGGAPLAHQYLDGYAEQGIQLINGYGITECSPVVAVNRNEFDKTKDGSVGKILEGIQVRIDGQNEKGEGEICVKGPIVMQGYYNMKQESDEVLQQGWFHTGDIGYIDEDDFLFITGRKKNLIILENGENISPEILEDKIQVIALVKEVVVYEEDGYLAAEVYPDENISNTLESEEIYKELKRQLNNLNKSLPSYQHIQRLKIRQDEFPKTTTKKIKR